MIEVKEVYALNGEKVEDCLKVQQKLYENETTINENKEYIRERLQAPKTSMRLDKITEEELHKAIWTASNWKAPGNDGISGYYWKYLLHVQKPLLKMCI